MNDQLARWLLSTLGAIALGAVDVVNNNFNADSPWFCIGLLVIGLAGVGANAVRREVTARRLNDEFEAGYRVGYRAGRRCALGPVRPDRGPSQPIPLRPKRLTKLNEMTWQDSDGSHPGSTRRP